MRSTLPKFNPLVRIRAVRDEVGRWPASKVEGRDASATRPMFTIPRGGRPSVRMVVRTQHERSRAFRADRASRPK